MIFLKKRILIIVTLLFIPLYIFSQTSVDYNKLEETIINHKISEVERWKLIYNYINIAKKGQNDEAIINSYKIASVYSIFPENLKYADSALIISKKLNASKFLAISYLNRGIISMDNSEYIKSLDDVLTAHKYALSSNDHYYIFKSKYYIAQNKIYLGQIKDANNILKECVSFFKKNTKIKEYGKDYIQMYIFSMMNYIDTNSKLNKQKENLSLIKEAINFCDKNKLEHYIPYFLSSEGTNAYHLKNYFLAIEKLKKAQTLYQDSWPHYTEIFYIGMSYWKLGNKKEAVKYFEKLDKEYYKDKNQDPQFRPAYELLIEYYASKNNTDKQLEYINKLMSLDKSYEKNYKYLFAKIHKEYDSQKLIDEKNSIENSLKVHQYLTLLVIIISIVFISFSTYKYFQMQRRYKERFEQIISKNKEIEKIPVTIVEEDKTVTPKIAGLSESTVAYILEQLDIFEKEQQFLDSKITQKLLSEKLGTNPTYLSKIINAYKGKNFSNYLNDLRLEYIVELLKTEHQFLEKEIKELANIAGFTNAEAFSDNFQRKFEIKPSYFIKMMKENIKTSSL